MTLGRDLMVALMFLTRLPVGSATPWKDEDLASSVLMFPIIGALIGLIGGLFFTVASSLGLPSYLAATLGLTIIILVTGALHEDGLADVADGFGGGKTRADKLRIMRDSRLGSYGTLALALALLARVGALSALEDPKIVVPALIIVGSLSRAVLPVPMILMRPARDDGLAAQTGRPHPGRAILAALVSLLLMWLFASWLQIIIISAIAAMTATAFLLIVKWQIDGITGDAIGALQQLVEIAALLALVSLTNIR
ncbi:MAG: adenosylcobinamide-GDP ribazoletransferase [Geminicoccaceae bacterium]